MPTPVSLFRRGRGGYARWRGDVAGAPQVALCAGELGGLGDDAGGAVEADLVETPSSVAMRRQVWPVERSATRTRSSASQHSNLVTVLATRQRRSLFDVVTLLASALLAWRFVTLPLSPRSSVLAGTTSGTMATTAAGIGGPPLVILFGDQEETRFRAFVAAVSKLASITGLLARRFSAADRQIVGALLVPLLVSMGCSRCLIGRLSPSRSRLRRLVLTTCSVTAVSLLAEPAGGRPT